MSLLLTFFVLLLSFSTIAEEDFNQAMMSLQGALGFMPRFSHVVAPVPRPQRPQEAKMEDMARRLRRRLQVEGLEKQVKVEFDATGGLKISLPDDILFEPASATLNPQARPVLEDIGAVLEEFPQAFIEVRGHTDASPLTGTTEYRNNYDLSYFRAFAVAEYIDETSDVPMEQFEVVALGPSQPLASNETAEGREANRRVELYVRGLVDRRQLAPLEEAASPDETAAQPPPAPPPAQTPAPPTPR